MIVPIQAVGEEHFSSMARQMGRWVNHLLGHQYNRFHAGEAWAPAVNFYEGPQDYCVVADLAGVQVDTIDLRIEEGKMMISGQREVPDSPECAKSVRVHLMEIDHGRFCRKLDLPADVDVDAAVALSASYSNGLLWIRLPKKPR